MNARTTEDPPLTNESPADNHITEAPVRLKLEENGFLDGRRCKALEMITTTDTSLDELVRHTRKAAMRLIVPKSFPGSAGALVLRTDLLESKLANTHVMALALAAGIICRRHANRSRSAAATTVWACLPGWERNGATRVHRNRPQPLRDRQTATFLPTDKSWSDADGNAGDHRPAGA